MRIDNQVQALLEILFDGYNRREYVHPDPLEFLYDYRRLCDREIVALIASALAYGRVAQILFAVSTVLEILGDSPYDAIANSSEKNLKALFADFKHRLTTGEDIALMLCGVKRALKKFGSLNECFVAGMKRSDKTTLPAQSHFVAQLKAPYNGASSSLLPVPEKGSPMKRLNLFLRWMARRDEVDPGGWRGVKPALLIVPLDTHMHKIGLSLRLTDRKSADMKTALEITAAFREIAPDDPVKYDFALTRLGIRENLDIPFYFHNCGV
ncbi:MAG: TIGR02757 family protein [Myxococcota bacterium]